MAKQLSHSDKMTIRLADNHQDINLLRPVSLELHAESRFANIPYSFAKRDKLFTQAIDSPQTHALILVEYRDQPIGFLFCAIGEYIVGTDMLLTTVYSFYVRKQYRSNAIGGRTALRLLSAAIKWSRARNSKEIMIHVTSGINVQRTDHFLRRAGFNVIGANYALQLDQQPSP